MAIRNLFQDLGQRVGRGLMEVGGYDPMQQVSQEEAARRRSEGLGALQRSLGRSSAILSGDPRRVQFAEQQITRAEQEKKLEEQDKLLDEAIKQSTSITDERKRYLYALPYETKASAFLKFAQPEERKLTAAIEDYEFFANLDEDERLAFMQATGRGAYSPELVAEIRKAKAKGGLDLTPGEQKLDQAFADTLVKWKGGEKQQAEANIRNLENKIALLARGANVSGPEYAVIPEGLMPVIAPGATGFKDEISDIVFQSLRATLGAQFTQKEGERLISATFNQNLPEELNIPRLQRLLAKTKSIYNDKQSQIDYYDETGSLKGYNPEPSTVDDILDSIFFSELQQLTDEQIIQKFKDAATFDERQSILRYAQSLQKKGE